MNPKMLLFNIEGEKLAIIKRICLKNGVEAVETAQADFLQRVSALVGLEEKSREICLEPFGDEMLIMFSFSRTLMDSVLDEMRLKKASVALKAAVTPVNINWKCSDLHDEIKKEHEAIMKEMKKNG